MSEPDRQAPWYHELGDRIASHWVIKTAVIPACIAAFFSLYFLLLRHPAFPVTRIPLTVVDRLVRFHSWAIVPYASLWVYVLLAPSLLRGRREIRPYCAACAGLAAAGLAIFWLWPSAIPELELNPAEHASFALLRNVDATGNACPSLHVAFAVFSVIWLERILRATGTPVALRVGNAIWSAAIVYSTMATRQHVAIDVVAGLALGGAAALPRPRDGARQFGASFSLFNRQTLAFGVSIAAKVTLFALGLENTHPAFAAVIFLAPDFWILAGLLMPNTSILVPTATCFATLRREVWLTIDDGPDPGTIHAMLGVLDQHGAKATFFLIGRNAAAHPDLVREIEARGHSIGNHTWSHPLATFWLAGPARTEREVGSWFGDSGRQADAPKWFRPPAGIKTFFLRRALARRGAVLVGWSARGRENLGRSIERPLRRIRRSIRPGAIVLVHECPEHGTHRVALLAATLDHLSRAGYRCVLPQRGQLRSAFDPGESPAARNTAEPNAAACVRRDVSSP